MPRLPGKQQRHAPLDYLEKGPLTLLCEIKIDKDVDVSVCRSCSLTLLCWTVEQDIEDVDMKVKQ